MKTAIVRHILVKDKDLAEQLKKKIHDGADFAKIAKQYSTCNSAKLALVVSTSGNSGMAT